MNNSENTKQKSKYYSFKNNLTFINWDSFEKNKLLDENNGKFDKDKVYFKTLKYKYADNLNKYLYISTPFIKINYNSFKKIDKAKNIPIFSCGLMEENISDLLPFFNNFDDFVNEYAIQNNYTYTNKIIYNNNYQEIIINFYIQTDKNKNIKTKIINHNVSKKYPKNEYFKIGENSFDFKRILIPGKLVKFIIKPIVWIHNNIVGTKIFIELIEAKFEKDKTNLEIDTCDLIQNPNKIII